MFFVFFLSFKSNVHDAKLTIVICLLVWCCHCWPNCSLWRHKTPIHTLSPTPPDLFVAKISQLWEKCICVAKLREDIPPFYERLFFLTSLSKTFGESLGQRILFLLLPNPSFVRKRSIYFCFILFIVFDSCVYKRLTMLVLFYGHPVPFERVCYSPATWFAYLEFWECFL